LITAKEETLAEAVRQRGKVTDLFQSLEGFMGSLAPIARLGIDEDVHHLIGMVSSCLFGLNPQKEFGPIHWCADLQ